MSEKDDVMRILQANADKTFVKRILFPDKFPKLDLGDGNYASHKMSWSEVNGKYHVFPTVLYDGKQLVQYDPDTALKLALKSGNTIPMDTPAGADWLSQKYKLAMGMDPTFEPDGPTAQNDMQQYIGRYGFPGTRTGR